MKIEEAAVSSNTSRSHRDLIRECYKLTPKQIENKILSECIDLSAKELNYLNYKFYSMATKAKIPWNSQELAVEKLRILQEHLQTRSVNNYF